MLRVSCDRVFEQSIAYEDIGNITVGNLHHFLPAIVKLVETDTKKRLLALHALKEVCPSRQTRGVES